MDEPLSNLDAKLRVQMRGEIARLQQRLGVTGVRHHDQTGHDPRRPGRRHAQRGHPSRSAPRRTLRTPDQPVRRQFIGSPSMNFFPAQLTDMGVQLPSARSRSAPGVEAMTVHPDAARAVVARVPGPDTSETPRRSTPTSGSGAHLHRHHRPGLESLGPTSTCTSVTDSGVARAGTARGAGRRLGAARRLRRPECRRRRPTSCVPVGWRWTPPEWRCSTPRHRAEPDHPGELVSDVLARVQAHLTDHFAAVSVTARPTRRQRDLPSAWNAWTCCSSAPRPAAGTITSRWDVRATRWPTPPRWPPIPLRGPRARCWCGCAIPSPPRPGARGRPAGRHPAVEGVITGPTPDRPGLGPVGAGHRRQRIPVGPDIDDLELDPPCDPGVPFLRAVPITAATIGPPGCAQGRRRAAGGVGSRRRRRHRRDPPRWRDRPAEPRLSSRAAAGPAPEAAVQRGWTVAVSGTVDGPRSCATPGVRQKFAAVDAATMVEHRRDRHPREILRISVFCCMPTLAACASEVSIVVSGDPVGRLGLVVGDVVACSATPPGTAAAGNRQRSLRKAVVSGATEQRSSGPSVSAGRWGDVGAGVGRRCVLLGRRYRPGHQPGDVQVAVDGVVG